MAERHLNLLSLSWLMLVLQGAGVRKKVGDWPEPSLSLWRPWALSQARVWERLGRVYGHLLCTWDTAMGKQVLTGSWERQTYAKWRDRGAMKPRGF